MMPQKFHQEAAAAPARLLRLRAVHAEEPLSRPAWNGETNERNPLTTAWPGTAAGHGGTPCLHR